jgi:hypothetical protein
MAFLKAVRQCEKFSISSDLCLKPHFLLLFSLLLAHKKLALQQLDCLYQNIKFSGASNRKSKDRLDSSMSIFLSSQKYEKKLKIIKEAFTPKIHNVFNSICSNDRCWK